MATALLLPFGSAPTAIRCKAEATRAPGVLRLAFHWGDPGGAIDLLGAQIRRRESLGAERRRSGLWNSTCFEAFLKPESGAAYWELNLSPHGEWNLFRFDSERSGMREENGVDRVAFELRSRPDGFSVEAELALPVDDAEKIRVGLTSVLRLQGGSTEYWAIAHTRPQADFHAPDSFLLSL